MRDLLQDIAFAWRNALKRPAASLLIVVTLALGIGVNSAMFSMTWHALLAPLPYADGERLVRLQQHKPSAGRLDYRWSALTVEDFRQQSSVFSALAYYSQLPVQLGGQGDPWQANAGIVSHDFFAMLGVQAMLGRNFTDSDDQEGAEPVLLLSRDVWVTRFGADPTVIGTTLETKNITYRIVGVLPALPAWPHANDVWMPNASDPFRLMNLVGNERTGEGVSHVIARLRENVTLDEANRDMTTIAQRLAASYPDAYPADYSVTLQAVKDEMVQNSRTTFVLLSAFAILVVLIASANVASLNLARLGTRTQELAIREAVGAAPGRITRQLFTESLVFALAGAALGLVLAWSALGLLRDFAAGFTPLASGIAMDGTVLIFSLVIAVSTGILSGAASAFSRRDINRALKEGGDKVTTSAAGVRRRTLLLQLQIALAFLILTVSALIMLSLYRLNAQDTGFEQEQVLALSLSVSLDLENRQFPAQTRYLGRELLSRVNAMPGVVSAGLFTGAPLLEAVSFLTAFPIDVETAPVDDPDRRPRASIIMVSEDYFNTLGIPLIQGRMFAATDDHNALEAAIINASAAGRFFPEGDALGKRIKIPGDSAWRTVVGVVGDVRSAGLDQPEGPVAYLSFWQKSVEVINLYVKSGADLDMLAANITAVVHDIDPLQAVASIRPLSEVKSDWLAPARLRAVLISLFGILALIVTLSGVIGVVSYNISQRLREIGIHMAIGATPANIVGMFVADGLKVYLAGLLLGLLLMLAAAPFLEPLLYQTNAMDIGVYLLAAGLLTVAVVAAIFLPARKAGAMIPTAALHCE